MVNSKIKREELLQVAIEREPRIIKARRFIIIMCTIFLASRFFLSIVETFFILSTGLPIYSFIINYFALGIGIIFTFAIYNGFKNFAKVAIIGGVLSILKLFIDDVDSLASHVNFKFYLFTFVIVILIQIICMLLILLDRNCKKYFDEINSINSSLGLKDLNSENRIRNFIKYWIIGIGIITILFILLVFIQLKNKPEPVVLHKNGNHYEIPSGKTYKDKDGHFSIQYPKGWRMNNDFETANVSFILDEDTSVSLSVMEAPLSNLSSLTKEEYEQQIESNAGYINQIDVTDFSFVTLGDMEVIKLFFTLRRGIEGMQEILETNGLQYLFNAGKYTYIISCTASKEDTNHYMETFDEMVKTFEVLEEWLLIYKIQF